MNIYRISYESVGEGKYPWVAFWGPSEDMKFIDFLPTAIKTIYRDSWRGHKASPGLHFEPGGRIWSDVIGSGGGHSPSMFISKIIIDQLISCSIPFLRATKMPIAKYPLHIDASLAPSYYVLEAACGISCDYERSGFKMDEDGRYRRVDQSITERIYNKDSWDGSDLFVPRGIEGAVNHTLLFCSERFKQISADCKWSNIRFTQVKCS